MKAEIGFAMLAAVITCSASFAEAPMMPDVKLAGPELKAVAVALERFEAQDHTSDLANFSLLVRESTDNFEVILVPRPAPGVSYPRGGATSAGREVHYIVSKERYEITKTSFAR